jgi:hypothetical protein
MSLRFQSGREKSFAAFTQRLKCGVIFFDKSYGAMTPSLRLHGAAPRLRDEPVSEESTEGEACVIAYYPVVRGWVRLAVRGWVTQAAALPRHKNAIMQA